MGTDCYLPVTTKSVPLAKGFTIYCEVTARSSYVRTSFAVDKNVKNDYQLLIRGYSLFSGAGNKAGRIVSGGGRGVQRTMLLKREMLQTSRHLLTGVEL